MRKRDSNENRDVDIIPRAPVKKQGRRENLIAARKAAGMTQAEMAERLNVAMRHYQRLEYGETYGPASLWDAVEDILGKPQRVLRAS